MKTETVENVKDENTWVRLAFIILFALALQVTGVILTLTVIVQFLTQLLTGRPNEQVSAFGHNLASFYAQTIRFLTFASDDMPWPFSPWPDNKVDDDDTTTEIVADGPVAEANS
ncbi:MAG: DUF4389 domain-containing protein [Alphaproteobacteria bacterium]|jgi:hypothetical protein|nr:DUF4389 domain-containing protein [Alphaproteobacteria bacterium]MBT5860826.1 DUF4389 domain-containing protein [Alphaproteobacteria bacterium]